MGYKKRVRIYNGSFSPVTKTEIFSLAGKWMELENIILSEVSQVQKAKGFFFSLISGRYVQYKYKQYYTYIHENIYRTCIQKWDWPRKPREE
jgi:hypothetical protein